MGRIHTAVRPNSDRFRLRVFEVEDVANSEWLHGLKLAVVAVVALAVWSMAGSLWTDRRRTTLGKLAAVFMLLMPGAIWQIAVIVVGGLAGFALFRGYSPSSESQSKASSRDREDINVFENFYRSGSPVFGGGHVVLPLLQSEAVDAGYIGNDQFVAGYGATQAVPGPLFTFSSYLGASMNEGKIFGEKWVSGLVALAAIFLPSFLPVWGVLPFWTRLAGSHRVRGVVVGINAGSWSDCC